MAKYILMLAGLFAAILAGDFSGQDMSMQIITPQKTESGSTIEVEVEFHKNEAEGFARFHQELPEGIKASPVYPLEANFTFQDNAISVIWLRLPDAEKFTLRYELHIDERLAGELELGGTLSYVHDNRRHSVSAEKSRVLIDPAPWVDKSEIVDVTESYKLSPGYMAPADKTGSLAARQTPSYDGKNYIVNILVYPASSAGGFAKIEESLPYGFSAEEMESKGGLFSFGDRKVEFYWNTLPSENFFIVSYKLIPEEETEVSPRISGYYTHMENGTPRTLEIAEKNENITVFSEEEKKNFVAGIVPSVKEPEYVAEPEVTAVKEPEYVAEPEVTAVKEPVFTESPGVRPGSVELPNPLEREPGVYYRVQIAAGSKPVDTEDYFGRRNIDRIVTTEIHEGWIKYSVGSYYVYRNARDSRNSIWENTPIKDAFVTAYNDGSRITVQEALMITNQQWYK